MGIAIDGMVIQPGDLILGDDDCLIAVTIDEAEAVCAKAAAKHAAETEQMAKIRRGENPRAPGLKKRSSVWVAKGFDSLIPARPLQQSKFQRDCDGDGLQGSTGTGRRSRP